MSNSIIVRSASGKKRSKPLLHKQYGNRVILREQKLYQKSYQSSELKIYTGCCVSTGTTFRASTEPLGDLTKILFYVEMKIFIKSFYGYKILFLRNHNSAQDSPKTAKTKMHLALL